eukprot:SAG11_NODE_1273_length_5332_cov_9.483088_3_plen_141_part_00
MAYEQRRQRPTPRPRHCGGARAAGERVAAERASGGGGRLAAAGLARDDQHLTRCHRRQQLRPPPVRGQLLAEGQHPLHRRQRLPSRLRRAQLRRYRIDAASAAAAAAAGEGEGEGEGEGVSDGVRERSDVENRSRLQKGD